MVNEQTRASIARIDAARARKIGQMIVTEGDDISSSPERVLVDLAKQDAGQILREYQERKAHYCTAPFDVNGDKIRFFPGGISIWSGFPGAGKTTMLRQFCCHLLNQNHKVFFCSLEENPGDLIVRLAGVAFGTDEPTQSQLQWFLDFYQDSLRLWGVIGIARHRQLLGVITELGKQGVTHAIIDSLMCLDISNDDFEGQRKFANLLAATARSSGVHIHLVAHPRKAISADQEPDLNDVAGAREIGGIADNVLFVRRGKSQNNLMSEATPMQIMVRKQRYHTGACEEIGGWLNRRLKQFKPDQFDQLPTQYLPKQAYVETL